MTAWTTANSKMVDMLVDSSTLTVISEKLDANRHVTLDQLLLPGIPESSRSERQVSDIACQVLTPVAPPIR